MSLDAAALAAAPWLAAALGLVFGSFANVCIHRIPLELSIVHPRSMCPGCGKPIAWYDNVPVLSWLLLRGRCRHCSMPILWRYPLVEVLVAAGFLLSYLRFGAGLEGIAAALLSFICIVLTFIDIDWFLLPDILTLGGLAAGFGFAAARGAVALRDTHGGAWEAALGGFLDVPVLPLAAVAGAAAGAAMPLLARGGYMLLRSRGAAPSGPSTERAAGAAAGIDPPAAGASPEGEGGPEAAGEDEEIAQAALREGMGLGDVKMLGMVGAFLGAKQALVTILIGSISGTLLAVPWLILSGKGLKTPVPFGPFLALGALVALFAGEELSTAYSDLVRRVLF